MTQACSCSLVVVRQALQDQKINAYHYPITILLEGRCRIYIHVYMYVLVLVSFSGQGWTLVKSLNCTIIILKGCNCIITLACSGGPSFGDQLHLCWTTKYYNNIIAKLGGRGVTVRLAHAR